MGGTTFEQYQAGVDVAQAFREAHELAAFEHGHGGYSGTLAEKGGYVVIQTNPIPMSEALALSQKLIDKADPRIDDKWGPAGAIPVIDSRRRERVAGFSYTPSSTGGEGSTDEALLEAVRPLIKLKRGETLRAFQVEGYSTPERGAFYSGTRGPVRRSNVSGVAIIDKPTTVRDETVTLSLPTEDLAWDVQRKSIEEALNTHLKLRQGEALISWRALEDLPGKSRVVAAVSKAKPLTRYVALGTPRESWEHGFASQAEARAYAVEYAKGEKTIRTANRNHIQTIEVVSVTRRTDGAPLVVVTREIPTHTLKVKATIKLAKAPTQDKADGWLFFGWASC